MSVQKEILLRDVVEFVPAVTYVLLALLLVVAQEMALAVPAVALTIAGLFCARAFVLFRAGRRVRRYQKQLTVLKMYEMSSKDLKISNRWHFIGMGFEWTSVHAQRAYDLNKHENSKFRNYSKSYLRARAFEKWAERKPLFKAIAKATSSNSWLNPWTPAPPLEGFPWLHAVGLYEKEEKLMQDLGNRVGHTLVLGTTRVGKTRLAELIISQDIARGDVVIVIDPKGDADLLMRCFIEAKRAGREDHFFMFHLGFPEFSAQYNPVGSFSRITEVATRIASQMPGEGQSAAFKEFVWGYVNQIAKGIVGVGETPSYPTIKRYSQQLEPLYIKFMDQLLRHKIRDKDGKHLDYDTELQRIIEIMAIPEAKERRAAGLKDDYSKISRDKDAIARYLIFKNHYQNMSLSANERDIAQSLTKAFITDPQYLSKLVASLDPFLEKMTTGSVADLIAPAFVDPSKDVFDWGSIIQSGGIVYVGLDALSDQEVARTVGSSMLADLTSQYGRIYKEGRNQGLPDIGHHIRTLPIRVHIDEGNEPADKSLIPSLNKAGGAGVSVTVYTQTSSDFEARLGNKAFANQMFGNFNTLISFRVQDDATAKMFTSKQRQVMVNDLTVFSGSGDSSEIGNSVDFTSSTQSRMTQTKVDLISVTDLTQLPKGQFFCMMDGNRLFKGRVPLLKHDDYGNVPNDIRAVADAMRENYNSEIPDWYGYQDTFNPVKILNDGAAGSYDELRRIFKEEWSQDDWWQNDDENAVDAVVDDFAGDGDWGDD